jgi:BolA family transcriptional regulator, general stress-responsive regulator
MKVQQRIEQLLADSLQPTWFRVENESFMHKAPPGSESHFKVLVVSSAFEDKSLVQRHRMVYTSLGDDILAQIHALTVVSKTPAEWNADATTLDSPACSHGSKRTA